MLGLFAAGERIISAELDLMLRMRPLGWSRLDDFAWAVSRLGDALPSLLLVSLLAAVLCAWRRRPDLAVVVLLATIMRGFGPPLKWLFASPRPPLEVVSALEHTNGFGYPSGHAFGATLVYGSIFLFVAPLIENVRLRTAVQATAILLVVLIAFSRVWLGVHWLSDVAGGLLFGSALLCFLQAGFLSFRCRRVKS